MKGPEHEVGIAMTGRVDSSKQGSGSMPSGWFNIEMGLTQVNW